ncbi:MAG TPA: DUF167 domain-containing protein [Gemmatimonadaceae bacterium]|nr:DUF167 domain-containing protein [Gemmatimonadaceae bacterium]
MAVSSAFAVTERDGNARFSVHVTPRAKRTAIDGLHGAALKLRVAAPPVDGAANAAVIALLAGTLGAPRRSVRIVAGETARTKVVEVTGITAADLRERLRDVT